MPGPGFRAALTSGAARRSVVVAVRDMQHGGIVSAVLTREGDSYEPRVGQRRTSEAVQAKVVIPDDAAATPLY